MAASDARGRGDSPLERYVRELLREADRARRSTPPRTRFDRGVQREPSLPHPVLAPPDDSLTDEPPARAG